MTVGIADEQQPLDPLMGVEARPTGTRLNEPRPNPVGDGTPVEQLRHAILRGNAHRRAGAACVYVPDMGTLDAEAIARLVNQFDAPIDVVAGDRMPSLPELEQIGVARVTLGPRPMRATLALVRWMAREWVEAGCTPP